MSTKASTRMSKEEVGENVTDKLLNRMFDVMLMYVHVFWYVHALHSM